MHPTPGQNLGPYRIVEPLGRGGMATVFKAYQPSLDRYVAIELLCSRLIRNGETYCWYGKHLAFAPSLTRSGL